MKNYTVSEEKTRAKKILLFLSEAFCAFLISFFLIFIIINWTLNCTTYDKSLWTNESSCISVAQLVEIFTGGEDDEG